MKKLFPKSLLAVVLCCSAGYTVRAQQKDTIPVPAQKPTEGVNPFTLANPQQFDIADIAVTGTEFLDKTLLLSLSGLAVGDKVVLPGDHFAKAIQSLWGQRLFSNIAIYITKIEGTKLWLEIALVEKARMSNFFWKGVKKGDGDELTTKAGLRKGSVITEAMQQNTINVVHKFYADKGFRNVTTRMEERKDPAPAVNSATVYFHIDKGKKVKVNDINFVGNYSMSDATLKKKMKGTKETSRFTLYPDMANQWSDSMVKSSNYWKEMGYLSATRSLAQLDPYFRFHLFTSAKFNETKYAEDKEKLIAHYNAKGHRDAQILRDTTYPSMKGNLNVEIELEEGRKYYFGNITWRGNTVYSDTVLSRGLGIRKGDIYNLELLGKRLGNPPGPEGGDIGSLYMDDGYLFFQVDPVEIGIRGDTIDYEIRIQEGPQATIKDIRIAGNEKTNEHVVRRELRTLPGDKFSRQNLIRSQREISQLGFFNPETIGINPVPNMQEGTVDIDYKVEERANDQLELSAGWGGYIGLTGTLGVTFNNFSLRNIFKKETWDPLPSGDGQKLSVRISSNGKAYRSYNFSFTEPWLGGKKRNPFSVSFYSTFQNPNAFAEYYNQPVSNPGAYFRVVGGSVSLGKQLKWPDDWFSLMYSVNYQRYKLKDFNYFGLEGFDNGVSNNLSFRLTLARSSVDQQIFPRSGSSFMIFGQFTPPYSLFNPDKDYTKEPIKDQFKFIEYQKYRMNAEWYVPLSRPRGADNKSLVLKVAAKFGYLGKYNNRTTLSPFGRFELGGDGLSNFAVYDRDIISQRGYPVYYTSNPKLNPESTAPPAGYSGFTMFNKYVVELRYPFSLNPSSTIFGLIFMEAANGYRDFKEYDPFRLRRSVGVGARFYLPMFGLLGFDYGIGLDRLRPGGGMKDAAKFTFMLGFEPE
ncbi:BamA/TamA family outer membrane protein [Chitinophaga sp. SYP-B3965]|uniref:BamA/OMP85 family outer membrane protein n=1 Tax=Chitinophaga sp. SYP-B3965 TaxID=2663120 RepID=UPI001299789B|nr:POTRA domain-containing protein [Chitinophaga sp. SYP-B3965]MRG46857.1 BamA/TamA family outer membrane protein [Chitinophaga sp. SYP-B3965]